MKEIYSIGPLEAAEAGAIVHKFLETLSTGHA